jgi:hypothetical protein
MASKRPQVRRCGVCNSVGHNKATCQNFQETPSLPTVPTSTASPLKFFVHHVSTPAPTSPHVVDLKTEKKDLWKLIESAAPDTTADSLFQNYHKEIFDESKPIRPELFSDLYRIPDEQKKITTNFLDGIETSKPKKLKIKKERQLPSLRMPAVILPKLKFPHLKVPNLNKYFVRAIPATAALVAFAFLLPGPARSYYQSLNQTKNIIAENSTAGFMALQESATALRTANVDSAEKATSAALDNFSTALRTLATKHTILQTVAGAVPVLHGQIESREKVLLAGEEIAIGNAYILTALRNIEKQPELGLTEKLNKLVEALHAADPNYKQAVKNLNEVDANVLPFEYQEQFKDFRQLFTGVVSDFGRVASLNGSFQEIFGGKGLRRYLLIFQNPAELRPTGGFMGSFAVMDVKDGAITSLEIPAGGTYDLQGQLPDYLIPPLPLTITNKRWEFQDANWYPDFPASAEKILWFYNRSRKLTADGVIAINASVLEKILGIVGPVSDEKRNLEITSSSALTTIQTVVETGPEKLQNKPKQILADLAPALLGSMQRSPGQNLLPLLSTLETALEEKDIQAYFTDPDAEKLVRTSGWGGVITKTSTSTDYLMVVNTNLKGQKSDARIKQTINHQAVIDSDGAMTDTVVITREHTGSVSEQFYGAPNIDYIRIYVPEGSTLVNATGFTWPDEKAFRAPEKYFIVDTDLESKEVEVGIDQSSGTRITSEFNKTVFGNWVVTEPGQTSRIEFTYKLPIKILPEVPEQNLWDKILTFGDLVSNYQLVVQKQSGITSDFESQIIFPSNWQPNWFNGENVALASNGLRVRTSPLDRDSVWSVLMKRNQ